MITLYEHHGKEVFVEERLRGKHREHCLCHQCAFLDVEDRENNCPIARTLYAMCCEFNIVTPVWECPVFKAR